MTRALVILALVFGLVMPVRADRIVEPVDSAELLRALETDDPVALSVAVAAIEDAPSSPELADVLFAAGRACEDRLYDPARALALYERLLREMPSAGVSIAAGRRATLLRGSKGHAREAAELARLMATADALPAAEVEQRATHLAAIDWPGADDAELFLADWLCRTERAAPALERYATLLAKGRDATRSLARRNAVACAIHVEDWDQAETLVTGFGTTEEEQAIRADLLQAIELGRDRAWLFAASWITLLVAGLALLASLLEACVRFGVRAPAARPPVEVLFIAPVAVVVALAAFAIDRVIAPAVVQISAAGLVTAWLSGATLDLLRQRGRGVRMRAIGHIIACGLIVASAGYIAMIRSGLLELLSETMQFGPGA